MIITPDSLTLKADRQAVVLPPQYLKALADLADDSALLNIGLHCSLCGADLVAANGYGDARWALDCACRTFIGANPMRES